MKFHRFLCFVHLTCSGWSAPLIIRVLRPIVNDGDEAYIVVTDDDDDGAVLFEDIVAVSELFGLTNNVADRRRVD